MQIAILVVLVVIAVVLAPWLLAILAAAVAIYGIGLIVTIAAVLVLAVAAGVWVAVSRTAKKKRPEEIRGPRKACVACQVEIPADSVRCRNCGAVN